MITVKALERISDIENSQRGDMVFITGKIVIDRKMGGIVFVVLRDQSGQCQLVFEEISYSFLRGDFVTASGEVREWDGKREIYVKECVLTGESNPRNEPLSFNRTKMDKLFFKSKVVQEIHHFMRGKGFLPVISPTIVGNWVEGKTNSFSVDYYGARKYLTLNSMLYHQIMLISGYNKIYEFSKVFRQDAGSPKDRLSEFVSLDISMSNTDKYEMIQLIEEMIQDIMSVLSADPALKIKGAASFDRISYEELIHKAGCRSISGAQLSAEARRFLNDHYDSFVWVCGFQEEKRRFFVKSTHGICEDYQLWFQGKHQIAAGGERENNLAVIKRKIDQEGKNIAKYEGMLRYYESGVPPMCEIGFGLDRFLLDITQGSDITDYVAFPRNKKVDF